MIKGKRFSYYIKPENHETIKGMEKYIKDTKKEKPYYTHAKFILAAIKNYLEVVKEG